MSAAAPFQAANCTPLAGNAAADTTSVGFPCANAPLRAVAEEEIAAFERDGVVVLRGVLAPAWLAALEPACARLLAAPEAVDITEESLRLARPADADGLFGAPSYAHALAGRGRFRMHFNTARREPDVLAFALAGAVGALAAALLRTSTVRFVDDILFVKEPHTSEATEWHDDDGGSICTGEQRCSMWVTLADVDDDAGPLWALRGSHRRFSGWRARGESAADIAEAHRHDVVTCPVRAGDVVVHHLATLHAAGPNRSDRPRRAWALRYAGDGARFLLRQARRESRAWYGLQDGAPLSGARFPVAWPPADARSREVAPRSTCA